MIKRPAPKTFSAEAQQMILNASAQQTGTQTVVKSYNPDYPVFEIPVNQKLLVYIPNHTITNANGDVELRKDKFAAHPVRDGRSYGNIRCTNGVIAPDFGLDGSCPCCQALNECWDLFNAEYGQIAKSKGIDTSTEDGKAAMKADYMKLRDEFAIKTAEVWYTFPIVVIDCEEKDGKLSTTPKLNEQGQMTGKPYFYSIRERTFEDKWGKAFDSLAEDDGTHNPAGMWAVLNFTYTPKDGSQPTKMDSARALSVAFKQVDDTYKAYAEYFDKVTEGWTPEVAMKEIVLDVFRDMAETKDATDAVMAGTRDKLLMFKAAEANALAGGTAPAIGTSDANETLKNFGVGETDGGNVTAEMPNVGIQA